MAAPDDPRRNRKPQSVEDWLASRLGAVDGEDDEETVQEDDPDEAPAPPEEPAPPPPPEPETRPFTAELPDDPWSARIVDDEEPRDPTPSGPVGETPSPPLPEPPPWERDTDPTPVNWELPAEAPDDSVDFGPSGTPVAPEFITRQYASPARPTTRPTTRSPSAPPTIVPPAERPPDPKTNALTQKFPPMDDEPSEGPEISDPGGYAFAEPADVEIEDLDEPASRALTRGPAQGGGFDEVFPSWARPPARRRAAEEETNALLQMTDGGMPTEARRDPGSDGASEPGTQWHRQAPPPLRKIADENTDIRGFQPIVPEDDPDDAPTVIVAPPQGRPREAASRPPPVPTVPPIRPPEPSAIEDPRTTAVIAWTASSIGLLMFVGVLVVGSAVFVWVYVL